MKQKLLSKIKSLLKGFVVLSLIFTLAFSSMDGALAARTGGRIGGGSFRTGVPSRTYTPAPMRSPGGYYGGGYGGGFGFPFLIPFFGFGGGFGGLFTILIFIAIANFLVSSFRRIGTNEEIGYSPSSVSVAKVQVGLLAQARSLQGDLDRMAEAADTATPEGRAQVLQEATLALLRHPEYWAYATTQSEQTGLDAAEAKFNQWALGERSKFTEETLSNVNNRLIGGTNQVLPAADSPDSTLVQTPESANEYIVVTLVVGGLGKIQLPKVTSTDELRQALSRLGSLSGEQLLAVEILWTPQATGDTLSSEDLVAYYPNLTLI